MSWKRYSRPACGVTGATLWRGREAKLRAYPSSGALYAVDIYPLLLRVEGLNPTVYHYRPADNALEVVKPTIDRDAVIDAMLPMERQMASGAAAMICLTGNFLRHERKYGEGGYRMLVAEAGHLSQNLILRSHGIGPCRAAFRRRIRWAHQSGTWARCERRGVSPGCPSGSHRGNRVISDEPAIAASFQSYRAPLRLTERTVRRILARSRPPTI